MCHRPLAPALFALVSGILLSHLWIAPAVRNSLPSVLLLLLFLLFLLLVLTVLLPRQAAFLTLFPLFFTAGLLLDLKGHSPFLLSPLAAEEQEVTVEGTVLVPARVSGETSRLELRADRLTWRGGALEPGERLAVTVHSHARRFSPGDRILFKARLRAFRNFNNPGAYDHETAMFLKGIACGASVTDGRNIVPLGRVSLGFSADLLEAARGSLRRFFEDRLFPEQQALFRALILGETQGIDQGLRDLFTITGLGHVLAVSGLHVGLVAWVMYTLFHRLLSLSYRLALTRDLRKVTALMTCIPVVGYALLAGFQVSCQRATVMVLAYLLSIVLEREKEMWSTLSLAALAVLAVDPHAIFSVSFQFSFGAVIGLLWLTPRISGRLRPLVEEHLGKGTRPSRMVNHLVAGGSATLSASLFLLPLMAYYFHRISLVSLPANLMVLPLLGLWVLPLGLLGSATLVFSAFLAERILQVASWGLDLMILLIQFWAKVPWAEVWVVTPTLLEIALFYGLWTCLFFPGRGRWLTWGLAALLLVVAGDIGYWVHQTLFHPGLSLTFLDVGHGSATLVQFPGNRRMLIDGGGSGRGDFDVGRMVVAPALLALKIRRIDYLVLSHPDSDHMAGLPFIASHFKPREFWHNGDRAENETYQTLREIVRRKGVIEKTHLDLGEAGEVSDVTIEVLHPGTEGGFSGTSGRFLKRNDRSLVLKLTRGPVSFLIPGDLERDGEETVLSRAGPRLRSDVLLAPHHGGRLSCSSLFLEHVKPRYCVISARGSTPPRFPHRETLKRLEGTGARVLRTDQWGAITISTSQGGLKVSTFLKESLKRTEEALSFHCDSESEKEEFHEDTF